MYRTIEVSINPIGRVSSSIPPWYRNRHPLVLLLVYWYRIEIVIWFCNVSPVKSLRGYYASFSVPGSQSRGQAVFYGA